MDKDRSYYRQVAELHSTGIDQGFLSSLGNDFLALLYESIDQSADSVLITESKDDRVVGFVAGASRLGPIFKAMLESLPRLIIALAPVLLSPSKLWRISELVLHSVRGAGGEVENSTSTLPDFELLSIAVVPDQRRNGVAKRLYDELFDYASRNQISGFKIVVGEQLEGAHKFYLGMGAAPTAEIYVHGNQKSVVYVQIVTPWSFNSRNPQSSCS